MSPSNLLRSGGVAAVLGSVLLVIGGLIQIVLNLFVANPGAVSRVAVAASSVQLELALLGQPLLVLGLVELYARQSGVTGIFGLVGFLVAFIGMASVPALGVEGVEGVAPLADLGWALFGVASLRAGIYHDQLAGSTTELDALHEWGAGDVLVELMPRDGGHLPAPAEGDHIDLTGAWVKDGNHGYNEIHPTWSESIKNLSTGEALTRADRRTAVVSRRAPPKPRRPTARTATAIPASGIPGGGRSETVRPG